MQSIPHLTTWPVTTVQPCSLFLLAVLAAAVAVVALAAAFVGGGALEQQRGLGKGSSRGLRMRAAAVESWRVHAGSSSNSSSRGPFTRAAAWAYARAGSVHTWQQQRPVHEDCSRGLCARAAS